MRAYGLQHPSGLVMVAAGEAPGGVRPEVEHQPWVPAGRRQPVAEDPPALPHRLLPGHLEEGRGGVVMGINVLHQAAVEVVGPPEAPPHHLAGEGGPPQLQEGLVHAARPEAGEPRRRREWRRRSSVLRAAAGGRVEVAVLQHHHPELPWIWSFSSDLAQRTQVQLLLSRVQVRVAGRRGTPAGERSSPPEPVILLRHPVLQRPT